jgi:hypothetical protein
MKLKTTIWALVLSTSVSCSSPTPAPKPAKRESDISSQQAQQAERNAEANDPCSDQNLKKATETERKKCDPTRDMFDGIRPQRASQQPTKRQKQQPQPQPKSNR